MLSADIFILSKLRSLTYQLLVNFLAPKLKLGNGMQSAERLVTESCKHKMQICRRTPIHWILREIGHNDFVLKLTLYVILFATKRLARFQTIRHQLEVDRR